ncbi:hypothetical protein C8J56DRAFT_1027142 [Mycena floridula]|nr:hypothetical protein C8J56DRAFT_1027142 [Mycena floridula]
MYSRPDTGMWGLWCQDGIMRSETRRSIRIDTAFSVYALQTFQPPCDPVDMQVLLQHSVQNYGPFPSELRARRDRTSSRLSPHPQSQQSHHPYSQQGSYYAQQGSHYSQQARKFSISPETKFPSSPEQARAPELPCTFTPALQEVKVSRNHNGNARSANPKSVAPSVIKTFPVDDSELKKEKENNTAAIRPRVGSTARRTALGWSKQAPKTLTDQKENAIRDQSMVLMTPGESLRLSRPRPRGQPTPARSGATPSAKSG